MPSDQVLSQEDIDAMLGGGAAAPDPVEVAEPPPPAAPAPAPAPVAPPPPEPEPNIPEAPPIAAQRTAPTAGPPPQTGPSVVAASTATDDELVARLDRMEKALAEMKTLVDKTTQELQSEASQRQALTAELADIQKGLTATIGYRAQETFTCTNCQTVGQVAAPLNCTSCGTLNWWGWYPPQ
jgi:hypothetical protein